MAQNSPEISATVFRVFSNDDGNVFVALETGESEAVERPVTGDTLDKAKLIVTRGKEFNEQAQLDEQKRLTPPKRAEANKQIEAVLYPVRKGRWTSGLDYVVSYFLIRAFTVFFSLVLIVLAYKGVQYSSEHFPEPLHFVVLVLYALGLAFLIYLIGTEENRVKYRKQILFWLGPRGMIVLPFLLLGTAGSVMASITYRLHNRGIITLEMCSGRQVTEAGLLDFYMWHFMNIVPILQLNSMLRWGEPYCFKQGLVGLLILAFQLLVVIPSFNTIRFYWKHRKTPSEYVYDPSWNPDPE